MNLLFLNRLDQDEFTFLELTGSNMPKSSFHCTNGKKNQETTSLDRIFVTWHGNP